MTLTGYVVSTVSINVRPVGLDDGPEKETGVPFPERVVSDGPPQHVKDIWYILLRSLILLVGKNY